MRLPIPIEKPGRLLPKIVRDCDRELRENCSRWMAEVKKGHRLPSAAAWILDNFAFLHAQMREVKEAVPPGYEKHLARLTGGLIWGQPRMYVAAFDAIGHCEGELNEEKICAFLDDYQRTAPLRLAELWAFGPLLRLALVQKICLAIRQEPLDSLRCQGAVQNSISTLRNLETTVWSDVVEKVSVVDRILRQDPAGVYAGMCKRTRDAYRHVVEGIARKARIPEESVAKIALELSVAWGAGLSPRSHVGYYLTGPGARELKSRVGYRVGFREELRRRVDAHPNIVYVGVLSMLTAAVCAAVAAFLGNAPWWLLALAAVPASQAAQAITNLLIHRLSPPRSLPRMDFSEGIPDAFRTMVAVPTLLISHGEVRRLLERLEIHYLANRDPNLLFALVTDYPDSDKPQGDESLLRRARDGVRALNERHGAGGRDPFYLFHRPLRWNPREGAWMGYERKRGKLNDLNALLLGEADAFDTREGDLDLARTVRYVLTLDSDTQLPRDAAREMVAAMAHPLNRPVLDPDTMTVRQGYALMQPRVSVSVESAGRSRLASLYSGQTGFDPYTTAVSDVYQDLHGQASFTGKGIYDVAVFHKVIGRRFPENTLLSHDLIEGEHVRVGLLTDIEVIDDFPSTYQSYSKRKHRWTRGDWQILEWLGGRVRMLGGTPVRNPLGAVSRWKIFDNLRRSAFEIALTAFLLGGWAALPALDLRVTLVAAAMLLVPAYADTALALLRLPPRKFWAAYLREVSWRLGRAHADALLNFIFLLHQACLMADAVARTLFRRFVSHRRMLEWQTMAQAEAESNRPDLMTAYLWASPVIALAAALTLIHADAGFLPVLALELWVVAPLAAHWINGRPRLRVARERDNAAFLRSVCLSTWRYFADLARAEDNWILPDNIQEDPPARARRTSPTNLGLQLAAGIAAYDLGYVSHPQLATYVGRAIAAMERMPRIYGHFYNWYETETLKPMEPRYISAVDSGNLAASLITLKQHCLGAPREPLIGVHVIEGLRDHCRRLLDAIPREERTSSLMRLINSLSRQLTFRPDGLFAWESLLTEAAGILSSLRRPVEAAAAHLENRRAPNAAEVRYWLDVLNEAVDRALADLRKFAPWLDEPFEAEFRACASHPEMRELNDLLSRITTLGELGSHYAAIQGAVRRFLNSGAPLHPNTRRALEPLPARLEEAAGESAVLLDSFSRSARLLGQFAEEMDFGFLYDRRRKLLHIGYHANTSTLDSAYYDLLASEARTAVFVAIAKGDIPREAWFHLGRRLTGGHGQTTLVSWSGTLFEYLMPCLFMKTYSGALLDESLRGVVRAQIRHAKLHKIPWGISEAACSLRDHDGIYQYQPFGVPELSANPAITDELVVAPYASMLAAMVDPAEAAANLKSMTAEGWTGRYGFYEAADFSERLGYGPRPTLVRAFMVHHQGMGLLALCNTVLEGSIRERFHREPAVQATDYLLQERLPALIEVSDEEQKLSLEFRLGNAALSAEKAA